MLTLSESIVTHMFLFYLYRQDTFVSANGIIITNIEDTTDGLQVTFFVIRMNGEVINAQAVAEAIQVNIFERFRS